jgi:hypothetical protein
MPAEMVYSKSKIDKAGHILSDLSRPYDELTLELEYVFEDYRRRHLAPLTKLTLEFNNGYKRMTRITMLLSD